MKLEKELEQLEQCKIDVTESLFTGLENKDGTVNGLSIGEGLDAGANVRNLAAWRRLNEFKTDIQGEKKEIEMEAMRVEHQIVRLKESKQWLIDTSIKVNQLAERHSTGFEKNRLIQEFKGYLRKKIGLDKLQKQEESA